MVKDPIVTAARGLLDLGPEALSGAQTDAFVEMTARHHPARDLYTSATCRAIAERTGGDIRPQETAERVFTNFIWTHFVCKLLMTASPEKMVDFALTRFDLSEPVETVHRNGPAILSAFHYTGYPLVALGLAASRAAPVISKARLDVIEQSGSGGVSDHVVYLSGRSAAVRLTRALQRGRSIWVLLDVVLPSVRVVRTQFLGRGMDVGAGLGKIARLSGRPCVPLSWEFREQGTRLRAGRPISPAACSEDALIQEFVGTQAAFVCRHPTQWLEWYSVLDEAPRVRAEVKLGNDALWARLGPALR